MFIGILVLHFKGLQKVSISTEFVVVPNSDDHGAMVKWWNGGMVEWNLHQVAARERIRCTDCDELFEASEFRRHNK